MKISCSVNAKKGAFLGIGAVISQLTFGQYTSSIINPAGYSSAVVFGATGNTIYGSAMTGGNDHAVLWNGSTATVTDLNPTTGITMSNISGVSGSRQGGAGLGPATGNNGHAMVWNSSPNSYIDLHPAGYVYSEVYDVFGSQEAGYAHVGQNDHAGIWNDSAASFVDLNPVGGLFSYVTTTIGTRQGGSVNGRAALWSGTASSFIDLNPDAFFTNSFLNAMDANRQIGQAMGFFGGGHAGLWSGTANSFVDLNPTGAFTSSANALLGSQIVGWASFGGGNHAMLWDGSSVIDLHSYLGSLPVTLTESSAWGILANGDIVGNGKDANQNQYALVWHASTVPEPTSLASLALFSLGFLRKRRANNR